jgi:rod shape determining protein RodA
VFASRFFKRADFVLLAAALCLVALGCLMVHSCTRSEGTEPGVTRATKLKAQLVWVALGLLALLGAMSFDYTRLTTLHIPIYGLTLLLLAVVLAMPAVRGTHRWLVLGPLRLQPAEFAQIAMLITIASIVAAAEDRVRDFTFVSKSLLWLVPAVLLILMEPDLGTPVVLLMMWGSVLYIAGVRWTHLAGFASAGVLLFVAAWFTGIIKEHQQRRLLIYLDPERDPLGDGYHLLQSLIAIGHGGLFGQGLFQGTQTQGHFIPDQETDFIFTALAEELGLVGGVTLLVLYGILLWRCTLIMAEAKDTFGRLLVAGVASYLGIHVLVNVGMTMGLMPVKGMPLPLVSYGGSSMLTTMIALGLVESVYMRRHKIAF